MEAARTPCYPPLAFAAIPIYDFQQRADCSRIKGAGGRETHETTNRPAEKHHRRRAPTRNLHGRAGFKNEPGCDKADLAPELIAEWPAMRQPKKHPSWRSETMLAERALRVD
jgi:hypothetical protein